MKANAYGKRRWPRQWSWEVFEFVNHYLRRFLKGTLIAGDYVKDQVESSLARRGNTRGKLMRGQDWRSRSGGSPAKGLKTCAARYPAHQVSKGGRRRKEPGNISRNVKWLDHVLRIVP